MWRHSRKVAQLLRSAACLHKNQSRSYLKHLVYKLVQKVGNMRSVNKVMRLIQYTSNSVFIFKLQIEFVPFKIVPLGGYTPPETLFPLVAALEAANRNRF